MLHPVHHCMVEAYAVRLGQQTLGALSFLNCNLTHSARSRFFATLPVLLHTHTPTNTYLSPLPHAGAVWCHGHADRSGVCAAAGGAGQTQRHTTQQQQCSSSRRWWRGGQLRRSSS